MASSEAAIIPAEGRDDAIPNGSTTATDDSAPTPVESNHTSELTSKPSSNGRSDCSKHSTGKDASNKKNNRGKSKKAKKKTAAAKANTTDNESDSSDSSSDSESDSDVEVTPVKKTSKSNRSKSSKHSKTSSKTQPKKSKRKAKKKSKVKPVESDSDSSSDSSESEESEAEVANNASDEDAKNDTLEELVSLKLQVSQLQAQIQGAAAASYNPWSTGLGYPSGLPITQPALSNPYIPQAATPPIPRSSVPNPYIPPPPAWRRPPKKAGRAGQKGTSSEEEDRDEEEEKTKSKKTPQKLEFKRVDWVWDDTIHQHRLQDTAESSQDSQYDSFIFHVRRVFDWDGKYRATYVDIKSKLLRECLQDVIGDVVGVSLVEETPKLEPNFLFLYLEELRDHRKALKHVKPAGDNKRQRKKNQKRLDDKRAHLKVLLKYIDHDYAQVKKSLYPMLEGGLITFDLLWALWKPNTLAYMSTYGSASEPRAFKVEMATQHQTILKGRFYYIDGKYFEYSGKKFGYGAVSDEIPEFVGARKITSLPCYPLKYHSEEAKVRAELIERGKKFVSLCGVHYMSYQGIAFMKRKKNAVVKFHISKSRIMVDPAIFRRINPNYSVSQVRPKDHDIIMDSDDSDDSDECCCCDSDSDSGGDTKIKYVTKVYRDKEGEITIERIPKDELSDEEVDQNLDVIPEHNNTGEGGGNHDKTNNDNNKKTDTEFTDEEYLLASPVVLGFAFSEKQWLEFCVSGIEDIKWNDKAWDSLVLEDGTKDLIKALVESRKYQASKTIDDVIQGKGKGLVTVLHGPPGTGKTLTAEGISELLKCPLYMASAGELGTDSRYLEAELQKILDICHAWGAILLLDEADVFLEKRDMHNIHRNALVSIFLRQLEYFQGILFLTTNRVETFDEAFQSRIHIALRYDNLDSKAKRAIFEMFLNRVKALGKLEVKPLTDDDYTMLSKQDLNGREIKNVVGSAQDLAIHKSEPLSMRHIKQVLNVHAKFGRDLKGGSGYEDAMRSYF
ncbi:hypothetical protein BGZ63DRAFT_365701 [Mariannaea sp. PMI_226]|nr:hypothetical protein BGZ63DRAFT_365701 [Mariannaea sp. PMI_226]